MSVNRTIGRHIDRLVVRAIDWLNNDRPPDDPRSRPAAPSVSTPVSTPAPSPVPVPAEERRPGDALDPLSQAILDALRQADDGLAMGDLAATTGASRATLRDRLRRLAGDGRVARVGAGLKTRYEHVANAGDDEPQA